MTSQEPTLLPAVELEPSRPAGGSVIWLHGLGAGGHDFEPIVPMLGLPRAHALRFVFPHAPSMPVTVNSGMVMPAWYDIYGLGPGHRIDEAGIQRAADHVVRLVDREAERGIPSERVVLAGFSQGGAVALHVALRQPRPFAGLVALSTYMPTEASLAAERDPANDRLPIFQAHGTLDPMVPFAAGVRARDLLRELGHPLEWHEYPIGHQVCAEEIEAIGAWLTERLELG